MCLTTNKLLHNRLLSRPHPVSTWINDSPYTDSADQIRRTLSLASLDALLLLSADASSRDKLLAEVSRAGRDLVWRDHDEKRLFPKDTERASVLAAKRGIRELSLLAGRHAQADFSRLILSRIQRSLWGQCPIVAV